MLKLIFNLMIIFINKYINSNTIFTNKYINSITIEEYYFNELINII